MKRVFLHDFKPGGFGVFSAVQHEVHVPFAEARLGLLGPPERNPMELRRTPLQVVSRGENPREVDPRFAVVRRASQNLLERGFRLVELPAVHQKGDRFSIRNRS